MNHNRFFRLIPALLAFAVVAPFASADSYNIGTGSSVVANSGDGLLIQTSLVTGLQNVSFNLNDGGSYTFGFFNIWTTETDVGKDDKQAVAINATLDFDTPVDWGVNFSGVTFGGTLALDFSQWGAVVWNAPITIGNFKVSLSNETFNEGLWWGLDEGTKHGATVKATVTQLPTSRVPDSGTTVAFLGLALVGLGFVSRRRVS